MSHFRVIKRCFSNQRFKTQKGLLNKSHPFYKAIFSRSMIKTHQIYSQMEQETTTKYIQHLYENNKENRKKEAIESAETYLIGWASKNQGKTIISSTLPHYVGVYFGSFISMNLFFLWDLGLHHVYDLLFISFIGGFLPTASYALSNKMHYLREFKKSNLEIRIIEEKQKLKINDQLKD